MRRVESEVETAKSCRHDKRCRSVTKFVTKPQGHAVELSGSPETAAWPSGLVTS